jgi:hypothetical protein
VPCQTHDRPSSVIPVVLDAGRDPLLSREARPHNRLIGFGVSRTIGDEPGFTMELEIDAADGQQRVSFWTTENVGKRLVLSWLTHRNHLSRRDSKAGCLRTRPDLGDEAARRS